MAKKKYTILITWASYEDFEAESAEEAGNWKRRSPERM